ncbi:MAG: diaminobutyrate--2-oxoglutarate transaminase [Blastopirellula sp.]|nr:MAG: diaminobutyrate--2-oxoglutarate transaminase [Blastopirellula sp.]
MNTKSLPTTDKPIEFFESEVRSYCRNFDNVFHKAKGSEITDENGVKYLDFLMGAGSLNYGHNNPEIKQAVSNYIDEDGVILSLDLYTKAKRSFVNTFDRRILKPRNLDYKLQFTGPTGTSVIESALKLVRKYTGRKSVVAFTNSFHGMSAGSLSITASKNHRQNHTPSDGVIRMPFDDFLSNGGDSFSYLEEMLSQPGNGFELPAAIFLETIQGEGGINVASIEWLRKIRKLTKEMGILMVVDDIQMGCGRTGDFFSFDLSGIVPDIVCLSKSLSGYGFPMALMLLRPQLDVWSPGEDNGTFRGNNLAMVSATKTLDHYWATNDFASDIAQKSRILSQKLTEMAARYCHIIESVRGRGLIQGLVFRSPAEAKLTMQNCFKSQLILETCGPRDEVVKLMPALTIPEEKLLDGLNRLRESIALVSQRGRITNYGISIPKRRIKEAELY